MLKEAVNLIQSLDPRPGQSIQTGEPEYVIPDVLVRKHNGRWTVELNSDSIPRLQINQHYAAMCNSARNDADSQFIRSNLQDAKWLIKSLESRNDTLLRVSRCIVEQQQAFFEQGEEYMKRWYWRISPGRRDARIHYIPRDHAEVFAQPARYF